MARRCGSAKVAQHFKNGRITLRVTLFFFFLIFSVKAQSSRRGTSTVSANKCYKNYTNAVLFNHHKPRPRMQNSRIRWKERMKRRVCVGQFYPRLCFCLYFIRFFHSLTFFFFWYVLQQLITRGKRRWIDSWTAEWRWGLGRGRTGKAVRDGSKEGERESQQRQQTERN